MAIASNFASSIISIYKRMKKSISLLVFLFAIGLFVASAQTKEKPVQSDNHLTIGGYGQIDYNQPFGGTLRKNGTLDVHRMVLLLGYRFDARTQFLTEIEYEHVNEVFIEQAYLQYKLTNSANFKAGLLLIPMGLINEYHEPLAFNGVERPLVDDVIAPTTWREIGVGFNGLIAPLSIKYQAYVVNGFNGYKDNAGVFSGSGLRKGRQKGINSYMSSPNLSLKADYFGLKNLQLGASLYLGKSQSALYNNLDENRQNDVAKADSSVINLTMLGLDARYNHKALQLKGQFYYSWIGNSDQYNRFTRKGNTSNDLGSEMLGWYVEAGYDVLSHFGGKDKSLTPFVRIEEYNTHQNVEAPILKNAKYHTTAYTTGLGYKLNKNSVLKVDVQFAKTKAETQFTKTFNAGVGVAF
jgi:hypothetical protein